MRRTSVDTRADDVEADLQVGLDANRDPRAVRVV
jgi:hypothetical protein